MVSVMRAFAFHHRCVAVLTMIAGNPALAQKFGPDGAPNPTASTMTEQQLLQQSPRIEGNIDQPIERARVLIQPAAGHGLLPPGHVALDRRHRNPRHDRSARSRLLHHGTATDLRGTFGKKISRFNSFERFAHWLTACPLSFSA